MAFKILDSCVGCTICSKNCPVDAITGIVKEKHTINEKRCVECGVCGNVCPKGAIQNAKGEICEKLDKKLWKKPDINKKRCSACSLCVDICAYNCLAIEYPKFLGDIDVSVELVNSAKCVSCAMCQNVCPLKAITMKEVQ